MSLQWGDTIVAVATPRGKSALAVIRLSGPHSLSFLESCSQSRVDWKSRPRLQTLTTLVDLSGQAIDRVLATFFPGPGSFTGEDVVELSFHGSAWISRRILDRAVDSGIRLARPGEFTQRAFLLGKLDLLQAEGIRDLIEAETEFEARVAGEQVGGLLSREVQPIRDELVHVICQLETVLEFVEDQVEPENRPEARRRLENLDRRLGRLEESFQIGRLAQEGLTVVIAGRPNVGKSSIFNCLMSRERAIVTEIAGTTRDAVSETVELAGVRTQLVDTAGLRSAGDAVEKLGVDKTLEYIQEADVILMVLDASSKSIHSQDRLVWDVVKGKRALLVLNKIDLGEEIVAPREFVEGCSTVLKVSATRPEGIEELRSAIVECVGAQESREWEGAMLTNRRQWTCVGRARSHLQSGLAEISKGSSEEFILYDLRKSLDAIGELTGAVTLDEILGQIFSTFCIGK